ncbi:MAG: hypothetical protein IJ808_04420 [Muribaculaceae bacterium]|nr:hypothetical protein [Muribaculaceae bacterium]
MMIKFLVTGGMEAKNEPLLFIADGILILFHNNDAKLKKNSLSAARLPANHSFFSKNRIFFRFFFGKHILLPIFARRKPILFNNNFLLTDHYEQN